MSSREDSKLNSLLKAWVDGSVVTQSWLNTRGIYRQLANRYVDSGWLERIGTGAYIRAGEEVEWLGGVYGLQVAGLQVHPGGRTALNLLGYGQFVQGAGEIVWLFGPARTKLPAWFVGHRWKVDVRYRPTNLFADRSLGLTERKLEGYPLHVASPERAMLEALHGVPKNLSVNDAVDLMRALTTARPEVVQRLMKTCSSVKTKRLFMLLSEHAGHKWATRLDSTSIDLGHGKRMLGKGGHYYPRYQLSLPEPLELDGTAA